jgi:hypothetical protein
MSLPHLKPDQIGWIAGQVEAYITAQRATFRPGAVPLNPTQTATMTPFFATTTLTPARLVVLNAQRVPNPPFYPSLLQMGFPLALLPNFSDMAAITFVDTAVFHVPITDRTLFHELVHVVQYEKLGQPTFAAKYVTGFLTGGCYENIPLEINAYELDARFAAAPATGFAVNAVVQEWIDTGRL